MAQTNSGRSASKRSRQSDDSPPNPTSGDNIDNTSKSEASSVLQEKLQKLSLPLKVRNNIVNNASTMLASFSKLTQRRQALGKISAPDHTGELPIVKSARAENHCPIVPPREFQGDKEMNEILKRKAEIDAQYEKDTSDCIRESADRTKELSTDKFRNVIVKTIQELAIDLANFARVRGQYKGEGFVPNNITDTHLGNAAAMDYITSNLIDATPFEFESVDKLAERYSDLHNVTVPKSQGNAVLGEDGYLTQDSEMEDEDDEEDPLKNDQVCVKVISHTKNMLNDLWPLMTKPFWDEHIEAEINRQVNTDTSIRTTSKKLEEANRNVNLNLEDLQKDPKSFVKHMTSAVREEMKQEDKKEAQKQKKAARKKSSGRAKKNQASKPIKNGQSGGSKSKKNSQNDGQQRSGSQQQNHANSSNNNNNNNNNNRRGSSRGGGRGRGRGNDRRGGGGRGRGRGRGRGARN